MTNLSHPPVLFRLVIIYTRFLSIYSRLYPFENVFIFQYQNDTLNLNF
jgi:hypothetical protein